MIFIGWFFIYSFISLFIFLFFDLICIVAYTPIILYSLFYSCSFFVTKERTKKVSRLTKICTRHAASNKNSHGTRYAQAPGNFYCFLANAAKFLMPRLHLTRIFLLLNLVYSDFVSSFAFTFYQRYYETYGIVAFKTYGNIVVFWKK